MAENPLSIVDIYNLMSNQKILLTYLGDVTPEITNALLKSIKNETNSGSDDEVAVKKKVYKIIVECLENISRHTELPQNSLKPSLFVLGKENNSYHIISGNYVYKQQADSVKNMLDELNTMAPDEVRTRYRQILADGKLTMKGGAGLGMVDIIQKSGNKLEYNFIPAGEDVYFFIIKAQVAVTAAA